MVEYPKWVATAQSIWFALAALLIFGTETFGISIPGFLSEILSQSGWDAIMQVLGAVLGFIQFIRVIIQGKKDGTELAAASHASGGRIRKYYLNPFKLSA